MAGRVLALLGIRNLSKSQPELFGDHDHLCGWPAHGAICLAGLLPHGAAVGASMMLMPLAMLADMGYHWRDYALHRHAATAEFH